MMRVILLSPHFWLLKLEVHLVLLLLPVASPSACCLVYVKLDFFRSADYGEVVPGGQYQTFPAISVEVLGGRSGPTQPMKPRERRDSPQAPSGATVKGTEEADKSEEKVSGETQEVFGSSY